MSYPRIILDSETTEEDRVALREHDRVDSWARAKWGSRVRATNYKSRRRFVVSLDGPPISGENHTVIIDEHDMIREVT